MTDSSSVRRYPRRQLAAEIFLRDEQSNAELLFDSADISPAGVFLKSDLLLDVGDLFEVAFTLPGDSAPLRVSGRVVRVDRSSAGDQGPGMGIEFVELASDDASRILSYTQAGSDAD